MQPGYFGDAGGSEGFNSPERLAKIEKERANFVRDCSSIIVEENSRKVPGFNNPASFNPVEYEAYLKTVGPVPSTKEKPLATSPVDTSLSDLYAGLKHLAGIVEHLEQRLAPVLSPAPKTTAGECAVQQDSNGETCPLIMEIRTASDRLGGLIQRVDAIRLRLCI